MAIRRETDWQTLTISSGGTESSEVDFGSSYDLLLLYIPTIDSATLAVQTSHDGTTYSNLYITGVDGAEKRVITGAGTGAFIWRVPFGFQYLKVVAGAAQIGGARTLKAKAIRS